MAAHPAAKAINTQLITDNARRGLLALLEGVRAEIVFRGFHLHRTGPRKEESGNRKVSRRYYWAFCQVQYPPRIWRGQSLLPRESQCRFQPTEYHLPRSGRESEDGSHGSWYVTFFTLSLVIRDLKVEYLDNLLLLFVFSLDPKKKVLDEWRA